MKKLIIISTAISILALMGFSLNSEGLFPRKFKVKFQNNSYTFKARNLNNLNKFRNQNVLNINYHEVAGLNGCVPNPKLNIHHGKFTSFASAENPDIILIMFDEMTIHPMNSNIITRYTPGVIVTNSTLLNDWNNIYYKETDKSKFEVGICDISLEQATIDNNLSLFIAKKSGLLHKSKQISPKPMGDNNCEKPMDTEHHN